MRIFLTGVSGYLGSVLATHLARAPEVEAITGIDVVAPPEPLPDKVQFLKHDMRAPDLAQLMAGHDIVVHTAFIVLWKAALPAAELADINVNGVRNVARAALASSPRRFVQISSVAAYDPLRVAGRTGVDEEFPLGKGDSPWYYGNGKALAERSLLETLGDAPMTLTRLRPTYVIGPRNRETVGSMRESAARFPGVDPRSQWIHEDDVAAACVQAVQNDMPGAYNVVPDDYVTLSEMQAALGIQNPPTVPVWLARWITTIRWRFLGGTTHPSWVDVQLGDTTFSNAKLRSTGWQPRYGSAAALRTAVAGRESRG